MQAHRRSIAAAGAIVGIGGVAWLAPLMLDQFVLFGDQEQTSVAQASRNLMVWPTLLIVAGAAALAAAGRGRSAAIAVSPLIAVGFAIAMPQMVWQLLAYGVTAPISIGGMLAAVVPMRGRLATPSVLIGLLLVGFAAALATAFLAALAVIGVVAWWLVSRAGIGRADGSARD
ncbi:MAG TPA: hypothetical protein VLA76_02905 [Candidatus Angelobacter sp.]|nr:hypothetical protein [Candidatus Angelobacter sp.]